MSNNRKKSRMKSKLFNGWGELSNEQCFYEAKDKDDFVDCVSKGHFSKLAMWDRKVTAADVR